MAGDGGGFHNVAPGINQSGRCRLAQAVERTAFKSRLLYPTISAKPVAAARSASSPPLHERGDAQLVVVAYGRDDALGLVRVGVCVALHVHLPLLCGLGVIFTLPVSRPSAK